MLTPIIAAVGVALVGLARGGSLDALAATHLRLGALLFAGLGLQVAFDIWSPDWLGDAGSLAVLIASNALVAIFLLRNWRLPGMIVAATGLALNLLVITVNGAMPVSARAAESAGVERSLEDAGLKHERMDDETLLRWLGDVIPVPPLEEVLSLGDVFLGIGISQLVYARVTSNRGRGRHRSKKESPTEVSG